MLRRSQNLLHRRHTSLISNNSYGERIMVTRGRLKPLKKVNRPDYAFSVTGVELEEWED